MGRVLPFIFVSMALVATAVMQAQSKQQDLAPSPLTLNDAVETELLDTPDVP